MYSQFGSKEDLFLAVVEDRIGERAALNRRLASSTQGPDVMRTLLRVGVQQLENESEWARLLIEFRVLAARDPDLHARYARAHKRTVSGLAELMEKLGPFPVGRRPYSSRVLAEFVLALDAGVTLERMANPEALAGDAVGNLAARIVDSLTETDS